MVGKPLDNREIVFEIEFEEDHSNQYLSPQAPLHKGAAFQFEGGEVRVVDVDKGMGFDQAVMMTLAVTFSSGVASGVVASAVYDVCKTVTRRLTVNDRPIRVTEEDIEKAIQTIAKYDGADKEET